VRENPRTGVIFNEAIASLAGAIERVSRYCKVRTVTLSQSER
jgi:hypothetical protein